MILASTLGMAMALQVTPEDLDNRRILKRGQNETHAGSKQLPGDRKFGQKYAFTTMGDRIRDFDRLVTDFGAASIGWPHRIDGKVYDDLDFDGREKLMQKQMAWVDRRDGYPDPAMARQFNNPGSKFHKERNKRRAARIRKQGAMPEMRQPK